MSVRILLILTLSGVSFLSATAAENDNASTEKEATPLTTADLDVSLDDLRIMVKPLTKSELEVEADAWFQLLRSKAGQIAIARLGVRKTSEALDATDETEAKEKLDEVEQARRAVDEKAAETEEKVTQAAPKNSGGEIKPAEAEKPESDKAEIDQAAAPENAAAEVKEDLLADITMLQDQRTAINDRFNVVLDSLEAKGGDVAEYRQYSQAVSGVELDTSDAEAIWSGIVGWLTSKEGGQRWGWNLVKFILILSFAYIIARLIAGIVNWLLDRKLRLTQLAERLISNTIKNVLMIVGFAVALTALEIEIAPVLAAIGATGLIVGLALQDSLSNVASGLMILINRPFDVGDIVTAAGVTGTVHEMNLVSTTFRTFDNQTIHVPNNEIWNNVITNVTANPTRRVDLEFGVAYSDDFEKAEQIIRDVVDNHELVLKDPEPVVVTHALKDSSVNIVCRPWAKTGDWWQVTTEVTREVKRRLDAAGISIPYPQQEVHLHYQGERA